MISTLLYAGGSLLALPALIHLTRFPASYSASFPEVCKSLGYTFSSHELTTQDGYILSLFRLSSGAPKHSKPVLLVHGLTQTSFNFILCKSTLAPAFRLASAGYDVWLLNTRGNHYSHSHISIPRTDEAYWNWTAYHIGLYDLPASIDYILNRTSASTLNFVGHSQGAHVLLNLLSLKPEFNKKIGLASLLAPVGGTMTATAKQFKALIDLKSIEKHQKKKQFCVGALVPGGSFQSKAFYEFPQIGKHFINDLYNPKITGDGYENIAYYIYQKGGGTSLMNLRYFNQLYTRNKAIPDAYDYGDPAENLRVYGEKQPPVVDFTKITAKLAIFYGRFDKIVSPNDGIRFVESLNASVIEFKDLDRNLDHSGFVIANDQSHFDKVAELMTKFQ